MADEETRPQRMCDVCGQVDDHPRHVFAFADGDGVTDPKIGALALKNAPQKHQVAVLAHIMDGTTIMRHMDCCREVGCPDGSCIQVTAGAESKKGADLVKHLTSLPGTSRGFGQIEGGGVIPEGRNPDPDQAAASASEGN